MSNKEVLAQRFRHDVADILFSGNKAYMEGASEYLFTEPVETAINVTTVLVGDGVLGDTNRGLVVAKNTNRVMVAARNAEIAH